MLRICAEFLSGRNIMPFLFLFFIGCGEREIVSGLDQREKIAVLSALMEGGIEAREEATISGRQTRYTLFVSERSHPLAIQILSRLGLPRKENIEQRELLGEGSLIPPTPEILALKMEMLNGERLRNLIQTLPNVVDAEVLFRNGSSGTQASVFVRHAGDAVALEGLVRQLATKTFPELSAERLEVRLFAISESGGATNLAHLPEPFSFRVPRSERALAVAEIFGWLGGGILLALFVGFYAGLHVSTLFWKRLERRRAERRRTGEYAIVPVKTSANIPVSRVNSEDELS